MSGALARIEDASVGFATARGLVRALDRVTLEIPPNRIVGVVGESGSGKSTLALALLGLLPGNLAAASGRLVFEGETFELADRAALARLRGNRAAMVFQDPMTSLNPVFTVGTQLVDAQRAKFGRLGTAALRGRAAAMLAKVGIPEAAARLDDYPHQFSGGMRQRIMIAMALLVEPRLLIADEATTALDVTIEAQIVAELDRLRQEFQGSILFISHSLGLVSELCDEVVVMYAGHVVESGPVARIFLEPAHPYTRALLACELEEGGAERRFRSIGGEVPDLARPPAGCVFAPRCPHAFARCAEPPPLTERGDGRRAACWLP
ncbi:MAG: ABC transporter ATP-binding protein [Dongiaceae bacterium]